MKRFSRRKLFAAFLTAPIALAADAIGFEPTSLRVERIRLNPRPKHRLVHFTDLHHKGDVRFLNSVVNRINAESPEFVCFTGDLIEDASFAPEALEILKQIKAPLYGIPGNHDYWGDMDFDLAREAFAETGGAWLMDQDVAIANGEIHLFGMSGVDFKPFNTVSGRANILLSHYPDAVNRFQNTRFDLILAGHSHGGQIRIPGYGALVVPSGVGNYQLGMYQTPVGPLYVNAGIGYFYANVRLFCRPEITVFEV